MLLPDLLTRLTTKGHTQYGGEAVSQLDHALQCATLAAAAQQPAALIVACLLHDIGHLYPPSANSVSQPKGGDRHEERAMELLQPNFPPAVTEPIRLHVAAKRYLCAVDPVYAAQLSPASQASLQWQGGAFSPDQAQGFLTQPHAAAAIHLRHWDDQAKVPGLKTPSLEMFYPWLAAVVIHR